MPLRAPRRTRHLIVLIYVDDLLVAFSCKSLHDALLQFLQQRVKVNLSTGHFVGIKIAQAPGKNVAFRLSQEDYALKILQRFGFRKTDKENITPLTAGFKLDKPDQVVADFPYRQFVGSLLPRAGHKT